MSYLTLGEKVGKVAYRVGAGLVLMGVAAVVGPQVGRAQSVDVRIYDSHHKDYHNWDDREDRAYRRYLAEKHYQYVEYQRQQHRRQGAYWKWRDSSSG